MKTSSEVPKFSPYLEWLIDELLLAKTQVRNLEERIDREIERITK